MLDPEGKIVPKAGSWPPWSFQVLERETGHFSLPQLEGALMERWVYG